MKVAFTSKDGVLINDHFGWTDQFFIYDVKEDDYEFVEIRNVDDGEDGEEKGRIDRRLEAIRDCVLLFCNDIGPTAAARVTRALIHPIKVKEESLITTELVKLKQVMKSPPLWLRKAAAKAQSEQVNHE